MTGRRFKGTQPPKSHLIPVTNSAPGQSIKAHATAVAKGPRSQWTKPTPISLCRPGDTLGQRRGLFRIFFREVVDSPLGDLADQAMLHLRAIHINQTWKSYMTHHIKAEQERLYGHIAA